MPPQGRPLIYSGRYHAVISLVMFLLNCEARPQVFHVFPRWFWFFWSAASWLGVDAPKFFRPNMPHWDFCVLPISSSQLLGVILRISCSDMSSMYTCLTIAIIVIQHIVILARISSQSAPRTATGAGTPSVWDITTWTSTGRWPSIVRCLYQASKISCQGKPQVWLSVRDCSADEAHLQSKICCSLQFLSHAWFWGCLAIDFSDLGSKNRSFRRDVKTKDLWQAMGHSFYIGQTFASEDAGCFCTA